jgi:hypothetical protein
MRDFLGWERSGLRSHCPMDIRFTTERCCMCLRVNEEICSCSVEAYFTCHSNPMSPGRTLVLVAEEEGFELREPFESNGFPDG